MEKKLHLIELSVELQYAGTIEEAKAFAERLETGLNNDIESDTYCGEVPCCGPVAPLTGHVVFGLVSRTIKDFPDETDTV